MQTSPNCPSRRLARTSDLRLVAVIVASCCLASCYPSQWGAAERSQKAVAEHATPGELHGTPDSSTATMPLRIRKVRVYVTPSYAAQVSDERKQIERLFDDVNQVLESTLRLQLEFSEVRRWLSTRDDDLGQALEELEAIDGGDDEVAWVVGFVGRLPILEQTFTQLGRARMRGRHFVMRAMNDAVEYDFFEKVLDKLDESERAKLYRKRVEHKETSVFLHELGHTLGVPHEVDPTTLMHARYNHESDGYSGDAADLMRMSLARRLDPDALSQQQLARAMMDHLQTTSASWVADERDDWLAYLKPIATEAQAASARPEGFDPKRWLALDEGERAVLRLALRHEREGNFEEAWSYAEALFDAHPNGYEIQDMRCRLAMRRGGPVEELQAHCASFSQLEKAARTPSP